MYTVTAFWHYVYIKEERLDMIFCGTIFLWKPGLGANSESSLPVSSRNAENANKQE